MQALLSQAPAATQEGGGGAGGRPQRAPAGRSTYRLSREAGLPELAGRVLLTPQQYCENLDDSAQPNEV